MAENVAKKHTMAARYLNSAKDTVNCFISFADRNFFVHGKNDNVLYYFPIKKVIDKSVSIW